MEERQPPAIRLWQLTGVGTSLLFPLSILTLPSFIYLHSFSKFDFSLFGMFTLRIAVLCSESYSRWFFLAKRGRERSIRFSLNWGSIFLNREPELRERDIKTKISHCTNSHSKAIKKKGGGGGGVGCSMINHGKENMQMKLKKSPLRNSWDVCTEAGVESKIQESFMVFFRFMIWAYRSKWSHFCLGAEI